MLCTTAHLIKNLHFDTCFFPPPAWRTCTKNWFLILKALSILVMEISLDGLNRVKIQRLLWMFPFCRFGHPRTCCPSFLWPFSPGVLLLNAVLTVRAHQANSHKDKGWEVFTDAVVQWLSNNLQGLVFLLWGSYAQKKGSAINRVLHLTFKMSAEAFVA